ncbi:MAG: endonuclease/exonuclease/phosphatase family protein [Bacteroidales bacterium]|nr:endonuclease/exonuclease/phosphatase family protein [Bacteroidales bacterium]
MKRFLLAAMMLLMLVPCFGKREKIRVMSFNVRHVGEVADTGVLHWDCRKESIIRMFEDLHPDIITLQEAHREQYDYIIAHLPGYGHVEWILGATQESGGTRQCVIYRKDRFDFVDWGHMWLKEDPEVFGKGWDAANWRACTWAILKSRKTGRLISTFNTHFDHKGWEARKQSAIMVANKISSLEGDPVVFLCGDLNMPYENERMAPLKAILGHANDDAKKKDTAPTFNGWGRHDSYLDHIFYRNATPKVFEVVDDFGKYGVMYLSDHNPVYGDFVIKSR